MFRATTTVAHNVMTIQAIDTLTPVAMFCLGTPELIIIAVVLVLLFGARRIPELGKSVGEGIRNFKKGLNVTGEEEDESEAGASTSALDAEDVPVLEADATKTSATKTSPKKVEADL